MTPFWIFDFGFWLGAGRKQILCSALGAMFVASCVSAAEQQSKNTLRIGFLLATSLSVESARIEAFRQGLRKLGYKKTKTLLSSTGRLKEISIGCLLLRRS
jgi:hypothetical protein